MTVEPYWNLKDGKPLNTRGSYIMTLSLSLASISIQVFKYARFIYHDSRTILEFKALLISTASPFSCHDSRTILEFKVMRPSTTIRAPDMTVEPYWNLKWIRAQTEVR